MELLNEDLMDSHHRFNDKRRNFNGYSNFKSLSETSTTELVAPTVSSSIQPVGDTETVTIPPRVVLSTEAPTNTTVPTSTSTPVFTAESTSSPSATNTSASPAPSNTSVAMPASVVETMPANAPVAMPPVTPSAPAPTEGGGSGARQGDILGNKAVACDSNYWILGIALGAIGGYLYAKSKNKEVLKNVFLISAIGGGIGYGIDWVTCKRINKPVIKPATPPAPANT